MVSVVTFLIVGVCVCVRTGKAECGHPATNVLAVTPSVCLCYPISPSVYGNCNMISYFAWLSVRLSAWSVHRHLSTGEKCGQDEVFLMLKM